MKRLLGRALLAGLAATGWAAVRLEPLRMAEMPHKAEDFADALEHVRRLQAVDEPSTNPVCRTRLWSHGQATPVAFVLLHGFSNCPAQFTQFAEILHAQGHNVFAPRLAHHGHADVMAPDFARLTVEEMVALVNQSCDALHGLGERRVLVGFSLGGAMAAWAAQQRPDLDHVVIVAPPVALKSIPLHLRRLTANVLALIPNRFVWWDGEARANRAGPPHAYPR